MEHIIAFGGKNLGEIKSQRKLTWEDFRQNYLSEYEVVSNVTSKRFAKMPRERRARIKNTAGWFVGGAFGKNDSGKRWRSRTTLKARSLLALDIDHLAEFNGTVEDVIFELDLLNLTYTLYATASSTPDDIRLRLILPVDQPMRPEHYQPIGRWVASQINIDIFDHTGFEECRLMYFPVRLVDSPDLIHHSDGEFLCRNDILNTYNDWRDSSEWPSSEKEGGARQSNLKAEDPRLKQGVIGAFCRTFNIHDVIERWLSDQFTRHDDHTYMPVDGTGAPGARVYDEEMFLYNNHESGPTSQKNLNAFDLVRLCLFSNLDAKSDKNCPVTKLPSYRAMTDFALQQPEVQQTLQETEFSAFQEGSGDDGPSVSTYDAIAQDIAEIAPGTGSRQQTRTLITRIANARFTPTDERALLRHLQPKYPENMAMAVLEAELKDVRKSTTTQDSAGEVHDLELELIQEFEEEHYSDNTLKRIGKIFWTFDQGLWSMKDEEIVYGQFTETVIRLRRERPDDIRELSAMIGENKTSALAASLRRMMAHLVAQRDNQEDPLKLMRRYDLPIINCRNAELHFDIKGRYKIKKHSPDHFFTTRIDAMYDPEATCPIFDGFLEHIFENAEDPFGMMQFAEELGGYIIQMSRWLKMWVMCYGPTDTGKTTYSEVITSLLGSAAVEKKLSFLRPDIGKTGQYTGLIGKLLFLDDDMDKGVILPDGDIKRISEEKAIQTDVKFGDDIRFLCHAFPMVCTNHWPRTNDITDAFVQRTLVLPFRNPYKKKDDQAKAKMLRDERSGILNRFIDGLSRLRRRGRFDMPIDAQKAVGEWLQNANPIAGFLSQAVKRDDDKGVWLRTAELYESYSQWHFDEYGSTAKLIPKQEFYRRCDTQLGRRRYTGEGHHAYKGYRLVARSSTEFDEFDNDDDLKDLL